MDEALQEKLTLCKLAGINKCYDRILDVATSQQWTYPQFFNGLLDEELLSRENNRFIRLCKKVGFPTVKTIDEFNFLEAPFIPKDKIIKLMDCSFIEEHTNLILMGGSGVGKTHLSTAIGVEACKCGFSVGFFTAASLGNKFMEMQESLAPSRFIDKLKKIDLIIIDELGYVELSADTTQLMFQIFSERYEKGSIIVTTNLEFKEWTKVFHDERMTTAIIDRLIHNSKIITCNGTSYHYKQKIQMKEQ
ncbi:MAG: IS21-like element helper ATPase IstB [Cellulosilyticaceae bacterium]